jgi:SAM-dependent methyltransferase
MIPDAAALDAIHAAGWLFPEPLWRRLSSSERSFAVHELTDLRTVDYYRRRIAALGFVGLDLVVDLGCGIGQWSGVLADANRRTLGVDINLSRLAVARTLADAARRDNVVYVAAQAETVPCADEAADAVFCYGVFMFTCMPRCLAEAARILKPGGRLYLNANTWGWYAHLLIDRGLAKGDWRMAETALRMTFRAFSGADTQTLVRGGRLRRMVETAGFEIVGFGREGSLAFAAPPPPPAYPSGFYGLPAIWELVAVKKG